MKALTLTTVLFIAVFIFANCHGSKKATNSVPPAKTTYDGDLKTVILAKCTPCHVPERGGRKKAYDNFANAKADIDEIIRRIELSPSDRGFMPFKSTTKLNDSTIAVFKKFRDDGGLER